MNKNIFSENCNLSSYTTIKVGGIAEYFAEPKSIEEFEYLIKWANLNKQRRNKKKNERSFGRYSVRKVYKRLDE